MTSSYDEGGGLTTGYSGGGDRGGGFETGRANEMALSLNKLLGKSIRHEEFVLLGEGCDLFLLLCGSHNDLSSREGCVQGGVGSRDITVGRSRRRRRERRRGPGRGAWDGGSCVQAIQAAHLGYQQHLGHSCPDR
jgi:hypothetical protein